MLQNNNTITINDNPITINHKLAQIEANAIIEDFEKDFGFDLLALPNLDLPLKQYEQALIEQAWRNHFLKFQFLSEQRHPKSEHVPADASNPLRQNARRILAAGYD